MKKMNNKGFSLIELIIVIAIMAVLVAIIAPNLTKYLGKSKSQTDKTNLDEIKKQFKNAISDAATDEITNVKGTYKVTGNAVATTDGSQDFVKVVKRALDSDTNTKSKVDSTKKSIEVEVKGDDSAGYTITAKFVS
jgi:type IV pilus assembly protein PilA